MLETNCHRELTKKTKNKGLTTNSWLVLAFSGFLLWIFFVFWAIPMVCFLYLMLWLLEFSLMRIFLSINTPLRNKIIDEINSFIDFMQNYSGSDEEILKYAQKQVKLYEKEALKAAA